MQFAINNKKKKKKNIYKSRNQYTKLLLLRGLGELIGFRISWCMVNWDVMKWETEILPPNWGLDHESKSSKWTPAENKLFENALAVYDKESPDRWHKVAAMIPGKTVGDVMKQYRDLEVDVNNIEAGLIPIPGYTTSTSPFTLDWNSHALAYDGFRQSYTIAGKRSSSARPTEQERKKGVPWTEEEHK